MEDLPAGSRDAIDTPGLISRGRRCARTVAIVQGTFYLLTGLWPWIHGDSFQAVTGPKSDFWLAQTVGLLLAVAGGCLVSAGRRNRITPELSLLGAGFAAALAVVDIGCVFRPGTTLAYLADAVVELAFGGAWWRVRRA